jgi:AcrR family transcriptional regulator
MIFYYFGSKEKLLLNIILCQTEKQDLVINGLLSNSKTPSEQLFALIEFFINEVFEQKDFFLLMTQIQSLQDKHRSVKKYIDVLRHKKFLLIRDIIQRGQASEVF